MKKTILFLCMIIFAGIFLAGCAQDTGTKTADMQVSDTDTNNAYHKITAEEAKAMMEQGNVTIVDVRRTDEYQDRHIPGAVLVPNEEIGTQPPKALPDKEAVLLVYCRTGVRSKQASDKLVEMGYRNVYDMGGINDWPYETEKGGDKA